MTQAVTATEITGVLARAKDARNPLRFCSSYRGAEEAGELFSRVKSALTAIVGEKSPLHFGIDFRPGTDWDLQVELAPDENVRFFKRELH